MEKAFYLGSSKLIALFLTVYNYYVSLQDELSHWRQEETIHLVNDGTGLGFGIVGGKNAGVIVRSIVPDGVADRDGRLKSGDHILQINEKVLKIIIFIFINLTIILRKLLFWLFF